MSTARIAATPFSERDRRWRLLDTLMRTERFDALIFASTDHRGHKGAMRYVCDYGLYYRHGFAVMKPSMNPLLVLPENFRDGPRSGWDIEHRYIADPATGVAAILRESGAVTVGVVGLRDAMRATDYLALTSALPGIQLVDAGHAFDRIRARKSRTEMAGLEESAAIADSCFERLLHIVQPGMTEREVMADMLAESTRLGADDTLFLTMGMSTDRATPGLIPRAFMGSPRDLKIDVDQPLTFSLELTGPMGYWTEFCRSVVFGNASTEFFAADAASSRGLEAACAALQPGALPGDAYAAAALAIGNDHRVGAAIGHSIGLDVVERPMVIGKAAEPTSPEVATLHEMMAFAIHPRVQGLHAPAHAYVADTVVMHEGAAKRLSCWPLELFRRAPVFSSSAVTA